MMNSTEFKQGFLLRLRPFFQIGKIIGVVFILVSCQSKQDELALSRSDSSSELESTQWLQKTFSSNKEDSSSSSIELPQLTNEEMKGFNGITIQLETGHPLQIVTPDSKKKLALVFQNKSSVDVSFVFKMEVESFDEKVEQFEKLIEVPTAKRLLLPFSEKMLGKLGSKKIRCSIHAKGEQRSFPLKRLSYMIPVGLPDSQLKKKKDRFRFALAGGRDMTKEKMEAVKLCGIELIRSGINWAFISPEKGVWKWDRYDKETQAISDAGVDLMLIVGYTPKWAAPEKYRDLPWNKNGNPYWGVWAKQEPLLDKWREFVRKAVERYQDKCQYWEIWNEADGGYYRGSTEHYLEILEIAYKEIKKVNPELKVMTSGFAGLDPKGTPHWNQYHPAIQERTLKEKQEFFDIHAVHGHGKFDSFVRTIDNDLIPARNKYLKSEKPLHFNETGATSDLGENYQAKTLIKKVVFAWSRGAVAYYWFTLVDHYHGSFGLLTTKLEPKASYPTYNNLIGLLREKEFVKQHEIPDHPYVFQFADNNKKEQVLVLWEEDDSRAETVLHFKTDAKKAEWVDMMGNRKEVEIKEGIVIAPVKYNPHYLVLTDATDVEAKGPFIFADRVFMKAKGKDADLAMQIKNPLSWEMEWGVKWNVPNLIEAQNESNNPQLLRIKKGSTEAANYRWLKSDKEEEKEEVQKLTLNYKDREEKWLGELTIPVLAMRTVPQGGFREKPDYILNEEKHLENIHKFHPEAKDRWWKGEKDLSASIWFAHDEKHFRIKVEVQDDVFKSMAEGEGFWSHRPWHGDSVQVFMKIPGQEREWRLTFSKHADGPRVGVWKSPKTIDSEVVKKEVQLDVSRLSGKTIYDIGLPFDLFELNTEAVKNSGIRFNLLVTENDKKPGEKTKDSGFDGFLQMGPGIAIGNRGRTQENYNKFPVLIFGEEEKLKVAKFE